MNQQERRQCGERMWEQMLGADGAQRIHELWRDICPDFDGYVTEFVGGDIWSRPQLDIRIALNNGASKQDVVETLLQIAPYAGFPACWEGLTVARKIFGDPAK
jgi:4-carboxymuconolactone decarboxylase